MSKVINETWRHADRLTALQGAAIALEIEIDSIGARQWPLSARTLADRIQRELEPDIPGVINYEGHNDAFGKWHQPQPDRKGWYSLARLRGWLEAATDLRPAVLFPAEEITATDFGHTDFEVFLQKDPTVELFAKILFAATQPDGSVPKQAEIKRAILKYLPAWSPTLLRDSARGIFNLLKASR